MSAPNHPADRKGFRSHRTEVIWQSLKEQLAQYRYPSRLQRQRSDRVHVARRVEIGRGLRGIGENFLAVLYLAIPL